MSLFLIKMCDCALQLRQENKNESQTFHKTRVVWESENLAAAAQAKKVFINTMWLASLSLNKQVVSGILIQCMILDVNFSSAQSFIVFWNAQRERQRIFEICMIIETYFSPILPDFLDLSSFALLNNNRHLWSLKETDDLFRHFVFFNMLDYYF